MRLSELAHLYASRHEYGISAGYADQLVYSVAAWSRFAGRPIGLDDLAAAEFNRYLDHLRTTRRPDTVRSQRGALLTLWWWAYDQEIVAAPPRHVRKLRPVARCPDAWTVDEIHQLIDTAGELRETFHGSPLRRGPWWVSLLRTGYDTSLRLADLLALRAADVRPVLSLVQHKTGRQVTVQLRPVTVAAIDQTLADSPRDLVWPLWATRQTFYVHVRDLVAAAGIRTGTFKWLRRSAVTALERVSPGQGTRLAGHAHRSTTETWYIDRAQLDPAPLPPL